MDWGTHKPNPEHTHCKTCGDSVDYIQRAQGVLCNPPKCTTCGRAAWVDRLKLCLSCYFEIPFAVRMEMWRELKANTKKARAA